MCVLRVSSETKSFAKFLRTTALPVNNSHEKGEDRVLKRLSQHKNYGFVCDVSDGGWDELDVQVEDAYQFLSVHEKELRTLVESFTVDDIRLDFPCSFKPADGFLAWSHYFPPKLLKLAAGIGIGIELTHYVVSDDDSEPDKDTEPKKFSS